MNGGDNEIVVEQGDSHNVNVKSKFENYSRANSQETGEDNVQQSPKTSKSMDECSTMTQPCEVSFTNLISANMKPVVKVYGNDIKIKSPFQLGSVYSLCYINNLPIIIIGPECKYKTF
jgi:hypothetical protein